ncbi:MAG: MFS transporter [Ilumatobacteraceae bacterium]
MTSEHVRLGRPPLWFIFSVTITGILANTLISPNIPDILADLGQPKSRAGLLVGIGPLPGVVVAPIIGILADRLGRRRTLPCLPRRVRCVRSGRGGGAGLQGDARRPVPRGRGQRRSSSTSGSCSSATTGTAWSTPGGAQRRRTHDLPGDGPAASGLIASHLSWRWAMALAAVAFRSPSPRCRSSARPPVGEGPNRRRTGRGAVEAVRHRSS